MYRITAIALIVLMAASTADAKLFGRRSRSNSGGGYQSFPKNTPPAPVNCPDGQCPKPLPSLIAPPITAVVLPQPELSIVVVESVTSIEQAEAAIEEMRATLVDAEKSLARMRLNEKRNAAIDEIKKRAENEVEWLTIEHEIADLKAELPQNGGDPPSTETPAE